MVGPTWNIFCETTELVPWAMFANGPQCTMAGAPP
jgi:hypothetical protein